MPAVSTYTIGEAARRSGFTAPALRYYEEIGLVPPSSRTGAGYRLYDDDTLDRLAFIARAKQLGCTLTAQLRDAATHLEGPAVDGPCSAGCACVALGAERAAVALTSTSAPR